MHLAKRPAVYSLPSYSLTGDLLSFLRCGLQYRYTRIGQLPSTRPVQAWFGQFIHGVLEEAYRQYNSARREGKTDPPPWEKARLDEICSLIKRRLAAQGLFPWTQDLEELGERRATATINELGPELFPLIHRAEVRLTGARALPISKIPERYRFREADRYEVAGVVDVITHIELSDPSLQNNRLVKTILRELPVKPPERFEVIIDYKGMRRPPIKGTPGGSPNFWDIYEWQIQTYAHLRRAHEDSLPVEAGMILYINEIMPTATDLSLLKNEIREDTTDVLPSPGSEAHALIEQWHRKEKIPVLPLDYRLARMVRIVQTSESLVRASLENFDEVVERIELCRGKELQHGLIINNWEKNPSDESTCTACDARTYCPSYRKENFPSLPATKLRT
jgi:hypothetical protein